MMSIADHLKDYKFHLDSWNKVRLSVQMNMKAISIILEKFRLYNVQEVIPYDDDKTMNAILDSYYVPIGAPPSTNGQADKQLLEKSHSVDHGLNTLEPGDLQYEPLSAVDLDISDLRHIDDELHIPTKSPVLASLMINHPGTITLFLQKQSNKIMQLIFEIRAMYDDFKKRHLPKMQSIYDACEVYRNRMICTHVLEDILGPRGL
ncbi:hypothetical protein BEWA_025110 [Theileria equi strain WA]|uniref:Uncharacterized protein n=1 Tax=Theileria equi strain WA TaxID=1537102 RepID=L0AVM6_THEEQ|nr:hypothetical protein BEWA_025110 [Theileria equi strain WA]AFZ79662.1 hypothetical protein BEWA_025110 [Theileria equi strain WA]|eukprot:XP_004829328.1 hypothetical protein BEWA_025110 [Theileria equi strain WA]